MSGTPDRPQTSPLDATNLDGHTVEELSDYLDHGRLPRNASIESSPGAQNALAALSRLRSFAPKILESEADARDTKDDSWIKRILDQISVQAHAGRDIPIGHTDPTARLSISEGAVRAIVREVGDELDGIIVERTELDGDVVAPGGEVTVTITVSLLSSAERKPIVGRFEKQVADALGTHTELNVTALHVRVHDDDVAEDPDEH